MFLPISQSHERPPATGFYRVQDNKSFTHYNKDDGFIAKGRYYSYWISNSFNARTFNNHLNWRARPFEKNPFISVFDNFEDAKKRALPHRSFHGKFKRENISVARIDTSTLKKKILDIQVSNEMVHLPVWQSDDGVTFVSSRAVREYICGVGGIGIGQKEEWFALHQIPSGLITGYMGM